MFSETVLMPLIPPYHKQHGISQTHSATCNQDVSDTSCKSGPVILTAIRNILRQLIHISTCNHVDIYSEFLTLKNLVKPVICIDRRAHCEVYCQNYCPSLCWVVLWAATYDFSLWSDMPPEYILMSYIHTSCTWGSVIYEMSAARCNPLEVKDTSCHYRRLLCAL